MQLETIYLKDHYPFLGENGADPVLTVYVQNNSIPGLMNRPGILLCPGGGYGSISPREAEPIALELLTMGCNVFVLTYSVKPHRFPTQLREAAAAMELIHANAEDWSIDPQKIAIMGFSAGGHLAAHYTNAYDCPEVRAVFPDSKPVQASILCYPVITAESGKGHMGSFRNLTGETDPFPAEFIEKFSCHRLVSDKTPPAFIWHTAADGAVPVVNSLLYGQALAERKIPFSLHIYPHGPHGLATVDEQTNAQLQPGSELAKTWLPELKAWLKNLFA